MSQKVFVHGFPGLYGGAATELHHQIPVWQQLGLDVHIVPTRSDFRAEPLFAEVVRSGVTVHGHNQFDAIERNAPVIGFCSRDYLNNLDFIRSRSTNTVFVNCMTWLFEEEKRRMAQGTIRTFLYQNDDVRQQNAATLQAINPAAPAKFMTFVPYFDASKFPFVTKRSEEFFGCGRISRQDADKYSVSTLHIYEYFVAPKPKRGLFLGFDQRSASKIGRPPPWIATARDHRACSQQQFYEHCEIIIQPTDTIENWPRVGLEAMSSGSVLIVDNRGGWRRMVEHGKTGWLCDTPRDFIYYASRMAYETDERHRMAERAQKHAKQVAGMDQSKESWKKVFEEII